MITKKLRALFKKNNAKNRAQTLEATILLLLILMLLITSSIYIFRQPDATVPVDNEDLQLIIEEEATAEDIQSTVPVDESAGGTE